MQIIHDVKSITTDRREKIRKMVDGLIHIGETMQNQFSSHGYLIQRNNFDMQELALTHFSYFAKLYSKIDFGKIKTFATSQLKRG